MQRRLNSLRHIVFSRETYVAEGPEDRLPREAGTAWCPDRSSTDRRAAAHVLRDA